MIQTPWQALVAVVLILAVAWVVVSFINDPNR